MVGSPSSWLGEPESAELEYKTARALQHPQTIVKAAVGFLNGRGGHVVIGVDDDGRPQGLGVSDVERARDRLQTLLIDNIDPRPLSKIEVLPQTALGEDVLVVRVTGARGNSPLYAERRHGMYGFWIRSGPTTRAYRLEEVEQHMRAAPEPHTKRARWDATLGKQQETDIVLVLQAQADELDAQALDRVVHPDSRLSLCRREMGWAVLDEYDRVERRPRKRLEAGSSGDRKWLLIDRKGSTIRFEGRADFLRWKPHPEFGSQVIYPFPLIEGTASFFWLLSRYAVEASPTGTVHIELGLWRPGGWHLGPLRPGTIPWEVPTHWQPPHDNSSIERVADLPWSDLHSHPDTAALSFITEVYEDFGYAPEAIPFWNETDRSFHFG